MWTVQGVVPFSVKFYIIFKVFSVIVSLASVPVPHPPLQKFLNILLRSTHTDYVTVPLTNNIYLKGGVAWKKGSE